MNQRVGVPVAPRQGVLVGMEGSGAMVGVAEKGEAEERPGLGIPREHLLQGPLPDQHGLGIRGTQRRDQASGSGLRIADPQEPVAVRDNLLRAPVGFPCRGGHQRPCGGVVRLGNGSSKQRAKLAMLHKHRCREPPRQRPQRAGADRIAGPFGQTRGRVGPRPTSAAALRSRPAPCRGPRRRPVESTTKRRRFSARGRAGGRGVCCRLRGIRPPLSPSGSGMTSG